MYTNSNFFLFLWPTTRSAFTSKRPCAFIGEVRATRPEQVASFLVNFVELEQLYSIWPQENCIGNLLSSFHHLGIEHDNYRFYRSKDNILIDDICSHDLADENEITKLPGSNEGSDGCNPIFRCIDSGVRNTCIKFLPKISLVQEQEKLPAVNVQTSLVQ